jgi:hypothetical protein
MGLESLIFLLLFSVLLLFIAKQSTVLYELVLAGTFSFTGFVFVDTVNRWIIDDVLADTFSVSDPVLPFRFQLPPPILSA